MKPNDKATTVKFSIDLNNPAPLPDEDRLSLAGLAALSDEQIDYSDAPVRPDAVWRRASLPQFPSKKQVTLRIDEDVLSFFRGTGKRYQSRINSVLRAYMASHKL
jgi:uncharacterized protein (DUF4415 family)